MPESPTAKGMPLSLFIPPEALPPQRLISAEQKTLAQWLFSSLPAGVQHLGMFVGEIILTVIRLLTPFGNVSGLSLSGQEKEFTGDLATMPLVCQLAGYFTAEKSPEKAFLAVLGRALRSPDSIRQYPALTTLPQAKDNNLLSIHRQMSRSALHPLIAVDLQKGMITAWEKANWQPEKCDSVSSSQTGLRRMAGVMRVDEFKALLKSGSDAALRDWLLASCKAITYKNIPSRLLDEATQIQYFRDFCTILNHDNWLDQPRQEGGGGFGFRYSRQVLLDLDDDFPELDIAPDGYRQDYVARVIQRSTRQLNPWLSLEDDEEEAPQPAAKNPWENQHIKADELAVMRAYRDPLAWHCTAPNELAWLLLQVLQQEAAGEIPPELATLLLSLALTGRSSDWLFSIHLPDPSRDEATQPYPLWQTESGLIRYLPQVVETYPLEALSTADMFIPVEKVWALPLPACLVTRFDALAAAREAGQALFTVSKPEWKGLLKQMTTAFRAIHPHAPAFTEGRLRQCSSLSMVQYGSLSPMLAAFISDQWRTEVSVPLFYTALDWDFLAKSSQAALERVWQTYKISQPELPTLPMRCERQYPQQYQGSPYRPRMTVLQEIVTRLNEQRQQASDAEDRYNLTTLTAVYGLSLFCGLRISEVSLMGVMQFDFAASWDGKPMPWLIIPDAKTNRFTLAARIVPLPAAIIPCLQAAMAGDDDDGIAFHAYRQGKRGELNGERLTTLRAQYDVKLMRWHAARQALHSAMLEAGVAFDAINAILGHETSGQELFNLCLPERLPGIWEDYLAFCTTWAEALGWEV